MKYWRCEERTCSAYVHTDGNVNYKAHTGTHNGHLSSRERIELLEFKRKVKETTSIARIYDQELAAAKLSQIALALAPAAKNSRKCFVSNLVYRLFDFIFRTVSV